MPRLLLKDNRGLTLVELLCGVVILAIVIVPLLHTFLVGASTEAKSRKFAEVTEAAQNLSEQVQAADADLVLSNSAAIAAAAKYYTYTGSSYALYGTSPNTKAPEISGLPKTYYIGIPNYTYGASTFDALIRLDLPNDSVNSQDVVIGNQMDASLDMTAADRAAVDTLVAECGDLVDTRSLTIEKLTRNISVNISRTLASSTYTYKITAVSNYTATIPYIVKDKWYSYDFSCAEQSSASVSNVVNSNNNRPVFSVFLFYNAYYKTTSAISESIVINSPDEYPDINFFIVNTNTTTTMPTNFSTLLWYKYQNFTGGANPSPVNNLIFTNLPSNDGIVTYRASKDALYRKSLKVTGYLVETKQLKRKFNVSVKLFNAGSGFSGTPLIDLSSTKLNY